MDGNPVASSEASFAYGSQAEDPVDAPPYLVPFGLRYHLGSLDKLVESVEEPGFDPVAMSEDDFLDWLEIANQGIHVGNTEVPDPFEAPHG